MFNHIKKIDPIKMEVEESPIKGRFYITPEGHKYPSITTLLGSKDKPWLKEWRESLGEKRAQKETKRAADRGNAIHDMAEKYLLNEEKPTEGHTFENIGMFNALKLSLKKVNNVYALEIPLYSDTLKIAGRVDCIAEYDGVLSVIDFKTSTNIKTKEMIEDYYLQATAYAIMFHEMYDIQIDQVVILIATEKGLMPSLFRGKVEDYIRPLIERINTYYTK